MSKVNEGRVFVPKGWGYEDWVVNKPEYCGKALFVKKGKKCSWHYHKLKDETFLLHSGELLLRYFTEAELRELETSGRAEEEVCLLPTIHHTIILRPGDSFHVPVGMRHQFQAVVDSVLYEFSTQHFDEDSYRVIRGD